MPHQSNTNRTTEYKTGADVRHKAGAGAQRGNPPGHAPAAAASLRKGLSDADARRGNPLGHAPAAAASSRKSLSNYVLAVILLSVIVVLLVTLMLVLRIFAAQQLPEEQPDERTILYNGREYKYDENRTNILFMGIDKDLPMDVKRETGSLGMADAILLVSLDSAENTMDIIAIPRETITSVTVTDEDGNKTGDRDLVLTYQYAFGRTPEQSGSLMMDAVSGLLHGVPIEKYCAVNFEAVPILNDEVGGVDVEVLENLTNLHPSFVKGHTVHLNGNMAFDYVHYRDINEHGTTLTRMDRQKQYILAYLQKMKTFADESVESFFNLYERLGVNMSTNITTEDMVSLTNRFSETTIEQMEVVRIPGEGKTGQEYMTEYNVNYEVKYDVFIADEDALKKFIIDIFYEEVKENE